MTYNELELIQLSREGDKEAFAELVKNNINKIYNLSFRLTGNENDAKDLTQDVFLKAFKAIKSFKGESNFSTWLYRICNNTCINEYKRNHNIVILSLDKLIEGKNSEYVREIEDTKLNIELDMEKSEIEIFIQNAISSLKPAFRVVIVLRFIENKSYNEIAEICGCSIKTVGSRLTRAIKYMRKILSKYIEGGSVELQ